LVPETRFDLRLELENGESHEVGLLLTGPRSVQGSFARIGGKSSRGRVGLARLDHLEVTQRTARDFFQALQGSPRPLKLSLTIGKRLALLPGGTADVPQAL